MYAAVTQHIRVLLLGLCLAASARGGAPESERTRPEPALSQEVPNGPDATNANKGVGEDFKDFSEEVVSRVDRIVKKKSFDLFGDPWTLQGIPIILPVSSSGFNLGIRLALQNIRRQDPHKLEIEGQILASEQGRYKHLFKLDYPRIFDNRFRLITRVSYDRDINLRYYGIGNDTTYEESRLTSEDPLYQNTRSGPRLDIQFLRYLGRHFRMGPLLGLKWTEVTAPATSLLVKENPSGTSGGRTHYFGLAMIQDTTDFEPYPSSGSAHELFLHWYAPFMGSDYNFYRSTYTYRHYWPMHPQLVLAHRILFEVLGGDIPFYELGYVAGNNSTLGIGGDRYFRGYDNNRFMDKIRVTLGVELRWDPLTFAFAKQDLTLSFVPFFDIGRVWPSFLPVRLGDWHASAGWGVRLIWNNRFVIRADAALTSERIAFYIDLGHDF